MTKFQLDDATLTFDDAHVPGARSSGRLTGMMNIFTPSEAILDSATLRIDQLDLRTPRFVNPLFPEVNGFVRGTMQLDSLWYDARVAEAEFGASRWSRAAVALHRQWALHAAHRRGEVRCRHAGMRRCRTRRCRAPSRTCRCAVPPWVAFAQPAWPRTTRSISRSPATVAKCSSMGAQTGWNQCSGRREVPRTRCESAIALWRFALSAIQSVGGRQMSR